ncbi:MAG: glycosyltransferase family 25 protein [Candidatus Fonsibacter ubiquis]|jgi:GR25 family glycosyltransferase involved in LPS biosynthesis
MKINLIEIPIYYINLDSQVEKSERTQSMLKEIGFKNIFRYPAIKHEKGRIVGCAMSHHAILSSSIKPPYIIIEDDCALNGKFKSQIEIPDDADALYLGISHWGRYMNHSGPYVHTSKVNCELVRVYNMLATHAIVYLTKSYIDICSRIAYHHGYVIEDHVDIGFAEIQKFYNVYCLDEPIFRQYEWNAVTTGRISENSYNSKKAKNLYDSVVLDHESFYRIEGTPFRSPFKNLFAKTDVSGVPGQFLPTKIL